MNGAISFCVPTICAEPTTAPDTWSTVIVSVPLIV
jgi:hypothetical protein